jgi:hypothetical protein
MVKYNNSISSADIQTNLNPKPLYERINKNIEYFDKTSNKPKEILKYKNHSGYKLPLTMDITK